MRQVFHVLCLLAWVTQAVAREYPVANVTELKQAERKAKAGDVLVMQDGNWADAEILFYGQGTAEAPITLRAQTPGKVLLTAKSRLRIGGEHLVVDGLWFKGVGDCKSDVIEFRRSSKEHAMNCRVTNCAITDYNPPSKKRDYKWVSLYGVSNRVDHCYFAGKQHAGTTLVVWVDDRPNYHRIDHNHFGPRPRLGQNGGETIRVGTSEVSMNTSRTTVEFNLFQECSGEVEIISNKSCENTYQHNTFMSCEGALTLRHGNRCLVEGNYFLGNHHKYTGGVRVIGESHRVINNYFAELEGDGPRSALTLMNGLKNSPLYGYFQVKNALIAFNTFVDCRSTVLIGFVSDNPKGADLPPKDCVFANNALVSHKQALVQIDTTPMNWKWLGNMVEGPSGMPETVGMKTVDVKLIKAWGMIYSPQVNSPLVDAAAGDFPEVTSDIEGQPRGGNKDVGCDEVSSAVVSYRYVTKEETGPKWLNQR